MRYRLVETIVPLAASADQLVDYVHASGSDIDEAVMDFVDWTYQSVPGLISAGVLPADLAPALRLVRDQALAAARSAPEEECVTAVLRPEWSTLRTTASAVLDRFRALGVPVPSMASGLLGDLTTVPLSERRLGDRALALGPPLAAALRCSCRAGATNPADDGPRPCPGSAAKACLATRQRSRPGTRPRQA